MAPSRAGGDHELALAVRQRLGADEAGEHRHGDDGDGDDHVARARAEECDQGEGEDQGRKGEHDVHRAHHDALGPTADVTGDEAEQTADGGGDDRRDEGDEQRDARAVRHPGEEVTTERVGPEPVIAARSGAGVARVGGERVLERQHVDEQGDETRNTIQPVATQNPRPGVNSRTCASGGVSDSPGPSGSSSASSASAIETSLM